MTTMGFAWQAKPRPRIVKMLYPGNGGGGGRVVRWCWVNFQCQGVLLIWIRVGQGPTALTVGAGGGCLDVVFSLAYHFSFLSPSLWKTARYRLKYCFKGPLNPEQPINQPVIPCAKAWKCTRPIFFATVFHCDLSF